MLPTQIPPCCQPPTSPYTHLAFHPLSSTHQVLLYTTIMGGVGALLPFSSKEDLELCQALEMHLRQEAPPLSGKDQLVFRSSYFPLKGVVDGDFCCIFNRQATQRSILNKGSCLC